MPQHIPTWHHGNAQSKRKIAVTSAAFLCIRLTEACGIFGQTSAPILFPSVRTCEIFLYIVPVIDYIDYYVPRLYFLHYSRVLKFLQRGRAPNLAFPQSFVSHVKQACASSAPIPLRSLVRDLLLLRSLDWELACRLSLLLQGTVDDEGSYFLVGWRATR